MQITEVAFEVSLTRFCHVITMQAAFTSDNNVHSMHETSNMNISSLISGSYAACGSRLSIIAAFAFTKPSRCHQRPRVQRPS